MFGGMATVYKARCHVLNRYVAVKILRDEFTTDSEFVRRFNTEAQAAASLTHPNIVSIYDVGNEGNVYYIVMELIQGKTLKEIITEDGALSWKWAVNIAMQIASALEMAHKNNIIHRDIKPHNIIITEDGVAKVTDFGIAKAVSNSTITAFGTTIGSVHYFSPEHARGGFTDAKSDLYSLGVVIYEMITGRVPFDADTPVSVALKHMQDTPVEPIKINPLIPVSLNRVVIKAMQKDPNMRYQSATEFLRDLKQVSKNPDGDFVVLNQYPNDFPTQKISVPMDRIAKENLKAEKTEGTAQDKKKKPHKLTEFFKKHKVLKVLTIILSCILVFAAAMGTTILVANANRPKQVQIPDLVGKTLEQVEQLTTQANLKYEVTEEKYSQEVEAGLVIAQTPKYAENYQVVEESTVKLVVSKGIELSTVPKVAGENKENAISMLSSAGLRAEIVEEYNDKIEAEIVIRQEPEPEAEVAKDSTVKIYVSLGTDKVDVPNVIGKTEAEAKAEIEKQNLKVNVKYAEDSTKSDGVVLSQDVEGGSKIEKDATITITVNQLPEIKTGTVIVYIKSLTGYKEKPNKPSTNTTNNTTGSSQAEEPKQVEVMVRVNDDIVYRQNHSEATEKISVPVRGIGNVNIKVYIDELLVNQRRRKIRFKCRKSNIRSKIKGETVPWKFRHRFYR